MIRLLLAFASLAAPLSAQLLEARIEFRDTGCIPCTESLQGRLERVRGVETVELDLEKSVIELRFAPANRVRLGPLRARVTQDGTEIAAMRIRARGRLGAEVFTLGATNENLLIFGEKSPQCEECSLTARVEPVPNKALQLRIRVESIESQPLEPGP